MIRVLAAASFIAFAFAQSPTFEVASIKPTAPGGPGGGMIGIRMAPGGRFEATGVTAKLLIGQAYDVRDFQISGGPGWMTSDHYDIVAKPESSSASDSLSPDPRKVTDDQMKTFQEQMRLRLQALLADRFQLKIHRETKELPVYALVLGKGGSKLQESKEGPAGPNDIKGPDRARGRGMRMGIGQLSGQMVQMPFVVQVLSQQLGRPVIDKTGLKGTYDFTLKWTPDQSQSGGPFGDLPPGVKAPPPPDPNGPSIFTAVQEQLGLRLESQKGPVEILAIDHVEKPSEN